MVLKSWWKMFGKLHRFETRTVVPNISPSPLFDFDFQLRLTRNPKLATNSLTHPLPTHPLLPNEHRQNRICVFAADFASHEGAGGEPDGAGAADEGVTAVHHEGAA